MGAAAITGVAVVGVIAGPGTLACIQRGDFGACMSETFLGGAPVLTAESEADEGTGTGETDAPPVRTAPPADAIAVPEGDVASGDAPDFGLVRVEPDGSAVIVGSGTPSGSVEIYADDEIIGTETAERSGDWAFVTTAPLPSGGVELRVRDVETGQYASTSVIVVVQEDRAGEPLVVASEPGEASDILQGLTPTQTAAIAEPVEAETPAASDDAAEPSAQPAEDQAFDIAAITPPESADTPAPAAPAPAPVAPAPAAPTREEPAAPVLPQPDSAAAPSMGEGTTPAPEPAEAPAPRPEPAPVSAPQAPAAAEPVETVPTAPVSAPEPAPSILSDPAPEPPAAATPENATPSPATPAAETAIDTPVSDESPAAPQPGTQPTPPAVQTGPEDAPAVAQPSPTAPVIEQPSAPAPSIEGSTEPVPSDTPVPSAPELSPVAPPAAAAPAEAPTAPQVPSAPAEATPAQPVAPATGTPEDALPAQQPLATDQPALAAPQAPVDAPGQSAPVPDSPPEPAIHIVPPSIDAVEIDGESNFFAGGGTEGLTVRLYVDNAPVGTARVTDGRWLVEATGVLTRPSQRVRVDMIDDDNLVVGRAEVDFILDLPEMVEQDPPLVPDAEQETRIAQAEEPAPPAPPVTPDGPAVAPAPEPAIPATVEEDAVEPAPQAQPDPSPQTPPGPPAASTDVPTMVGVTEGTRTTSGLAIIRRGDNLWTIARRVYGEGMRYTQIFEANTDQIRNPDLIYPGQVFDLPETDQVVGAEDD